MLNTTIEENGERALRYEVQRFKGSFGLQSAFTGFGPAVDAAWDNITDGMMIVSADFEPLNMLRQSCKPRKLRKLTALGPVGGAIGITKEQWEAVNEYPEYPVMLEQDHGSGRYLASLDVFHQFHCVVSITATQQNYQHDLTLHSGLTS